MKKTIVICITVFVTVLSSIFLFNYMQILKMKEENRINNSLQLKINEYDKCYKYSNKIYVNIGTLDTNTGTINGDMTLNSDSYNNLLKLKDCLKIAYNK